MTLDFMSFTLYYEKIFLLTAFTLLITLALQSINSFLLNQNLILIFCVYIKNERE